MEPRAGSATKTVLGKREVLQSSNHNQEIGQRLVALVKNPPTMQETWVQLIPGLGRSPEEGISTLGTPPWDPESQDIPREVQGALPGLRASRGKRGACLEEEVGGLGVDFLTRYDGELR